ncbi:disulfide bond formation protein DsbA [Georgenia deserti]|uniref:Disulfide bond formation protein DsbA n=1 Tax=Georgenia deserti TaxID=2093781 RepID=A0ABW4LA74_9MICO
MTGRTTAEFWFDPSCPYTWLTSRWLVEVARVRPVDIRWRLMSLSVLNEDREDDPEGDSAGYLWVPVRVCMATLSEHGEAALARLYAAMWTTARTGDWLGDLYAALRAADLPESLAHAGGSTVHDAAVRASHAEAIAQLGEHVGTPVVRTTGPEGSSTAFFGPVISRVPTGEDAGRLWDGAVLVAAIPGFHELKGGPHAEPELDPTY